jgi:hypothetical protein
MLEIPVVKENPLNRIFLPESGKKKRVFPYAKSVCNKRPDTVGELQSMVFQ